MSVRSASTVEVKLRKCECPRTPPRGSKIEARIPARARPAGVCLVANGVSFVGGVVTRLAASIRESGCVWSALFGWGRAVRRCLAGLLRPDPRGLFRSVVSCQGRSCVASASPMSLRSTLDKPPPTEKRGQDRGGAGKRLGVARYALVLRCVGFGLLRTVVGWVGLLLVRPTLRGGGGLGGWLGWSVIVWCGG
jgi:hypothetical protein